MFGKVISWSVHLFTASGLVFGFLALISISKHEFVQSFLFLSTAFLIDGIDGTLARKFKIKEVLPKINGSMIDDVIDFANDVVISAYFIFECGWIEGGEYHYLLPDGYRWFGAIIILLVSALYYGKTEMVTEDKYFNGFPALWNVVAFYLFFVIQLAGWPSVVFIVIVAFSHFLPIKFPYPSQGKRFVLIRWIATILFAATNISILILLAIGLEFLWLRITSLATAGYFIWEAVYVSFFDKKAPEKSLPISKEK